MWNDAVPKHVQIPCDWPFRVIHRNSNICLLDGNGKEGKISIEGLKTVTIQPKNELKKCPYSPKNVLEPLPRCLDSSTTSPTSPPLAHNSTVGEHGHCLFSLTQNHWLLSLPPIDFRGRGSKSIGSLDCSIAIAGVCHSYYGHLFIFAVMWPGPEITDGPVTHIRAS